MVVELMRVLKTMNVSFQHFNFTENFCQRRETRRKGDCNQPACVKL